MFKQPGIVGVVFRVVKSRFPRLSYWLRWPRTYHFYADSELGTEGGNGSKKSPVRTMQQLANVAPRVIDRRTVLHAKGTFSGPMAIEKHILTTGELVLKD